MFYVNRKVGKKYEVVDTDDGVAELYTKKALREIVGWGIRINGVCKYGSKFSIIPVGDLLHTDSKIMAKNKLVNGTCTGIAGFDLAVNSSEILALPLGNEFFEYADNNSMDSIYIIQIPEEVTRIDEDFTKNFNVVQPKDLLLCIELPSTLRDICCDSFSNWRVVKIKFGCEVIDRLYRKDYLYNYISIKSLTDNDTLRVKEMEGCCLDISGMGTLRLPDITKLDNICIRRILNKGITEFRLGRGITYLGDFCHNVGQTSRGDEEKYLNSANLNRCANIVYIPDNCNLREINFVCASIYRKSNAGNLYKPTVYGSYILVCSESEYESLRDCLNEDNVSIQVALGVLTYKDEEDLKDIQTYIRDYCKGYRRHIENYFTKDSLGYITRMSLKNRFDVD